MYLQLHKARHSHTAFLVGHDTGIRHGGCSKDERAFRSRLREKKNSRVFQSHKFPALVVAASSESQVLMPIIVGFLVVVILFGYFFVKIRAAIRKVRQEESDSNDVEVRVHAVKKNVVREKTLGCDLGDTITRALWDLTLLLLLPLLLC